MTRERQRQDIGTLGDALYVVAVPIGNSSDITDRARSVLASVKGILCEDTRKTSQLLRSLGISEPILKRWDVHFEKDSHRVVGVLEDLQTEGGAWALVTDAGTPGVQDPGSVLVHQARRMGMEVVPVPGPSSITTFVSISGLEGSGFCFRGFFPRSAGDRAREWNDFLKFSEIQQNWIYFESPDRILETLRFFSEQADPDVLWTGAKELTKTHEKWISGVPSKVLQVLEDDPDDKAHRGEWVFALSRGTVKSAMNSDASRTEWKRVLRILLECTVPVSEAVRKVSEEFQISKNTVYAEALTQKKEI